MQAVIFDLDGVIADTATFHYMAWKQLAKELGIDIDEQFNEQLKGVSREDSLERILAKGGKENVYTPTEKARFAKEKNDVYVKLLEGLTSKDTLPGIRQLCIDLKANNVKIGIASASKNAPVILDKIDLMQYIDIIADPSEVTQGKPAPDVFLAAAKQLGVAVEDAIGIEDAPAGVAAIKAANMRAVSIGESQEIRAAGADANLSSTACLTYDFLRNL